MKKLSVFVLVLFFAATLVFAGGSSQGAANDKTIRIGMYPSDSEPAAKKLWDGYIAQFNKKYPGMTAVGSYYFYALETYPALAQAGQAVTIFSTWFTEPPNLVRNGLIKDITDEVRAKNLEAKMTPAARDLVTQNGRIYAIPYESYALGVHLNLPLFRQAGLINPQGLPTYPKNWDEFVVIAKQIKERTGRPALCLLAKDNAGGWHFTNIAWTFGATFVTQQGSRWVANLNSPQAIAALQFVKDLKWVHDVLTADPTNEDWSTGWRAVGTGAAAMYIGAGDGVNQLCEVNGLPASDCALIPFPAGPGGQYSLVGGSIYAFAPNATSAQVSAGIDFLEIIGRLPVVNAEVRANMEKDAADRRARGIPIIPDFSTWNDPAYTAMRDEVLKKYTNVDMRLFQDYFAQTQRPGNLRPEDGGPLTQDLYAELTKALQAVLTDRNANPQALLNTAQQNFQRLLDALR